MERAVEPFKGYWDVPGGFLDTGERPEAGTVRELREETGLEIARRSCSASSWTPTEMTIHTLTLCYLARVVGGEARAGSDAASLRWFPLDALPEQIAFPWEAEAIPVLKSRLP